MVDYVVCALTNLFRMYLIRRFIIAFLNRSRTDKWKEIVAFMGFYTINTALFWEFHTVWVNILSNLIGISIIVALYTKSVRTNIFVVSVIYFINASCDVVATLLFVNYQDGKPHNQLCFIMTVLLICISENLTEKVIATPQNAETVQSLPLILVPVCSISVICFLGYSKACGDFVRIVVSIGFLIINFLMLCLYDLLLRSVSQKYETDALKQKVQVYANQLNVILQSEEKIKILKHDMKHHMNELKLLANRQHVEGIQEYIDHIESFVENPDEICSSGNIEIDSVLNYMLQRAKNELNTVDINVMLPEGIKHSFDINVLLGNLLENAIEAARQTERKYMGVDIALKRDVLKIKIENSFLSENIIHGEDKRIPFLTTKHSKELHGIGLTSVRQIVEKHNGVMEILSDNDVFCVNLVMYMSRYENNTWN